MSTRSQKLYERVSKVVGISNPKITDVDIYDALNDTQDQLAQRLLCLEGSGNITTNSSGVASVPSGFYRLKRIVLPDSTQIFPQQVDVEEYDNLQHLLFSDVSTTVQYYKIWNSQITFFPNPGVQTYSSFFYAVPTTTISSSVAPEIPDYMDEALRYGALSDCLPQSDREGDLEKAQYYKNLFDEELSRLEMIWRKTKTNSNTVYHHDV